MSSHTKPLRSYELDDQWVQSVSFLPKDGKINSDRYSVMFIKDAQLAKVHHPSKNDLPSVNKIFRSEESNSKTSKTNYELVEDLDIPEECFCLNFCNLFRKRSQLMTKS